MGLSGVGYQDGTSRICISYLPQTHRDTVWSVLPVLQGIKVECTLAGGICDGLCFKLDTT
jgi:hypothetical protein